MWTALAERVVAIATVVMLDALLAFHPFLLFLFSALAVFLTSACTCFLRLYIFDAKAGSKDRHLYLLAEFWIDGYAPLDLEVLTGTSP